MHRSHRSVVVVAAGWLLLSAAAHAAQGPGRLTPAHVAEFKDVQVVRVEVKEEHEATSATIAADVSRVAGHLLRAVGWDVVADPDAEAQALLVMELHGLIGHVPRRQAGATAAEGDTPQPLRAGRMAGAYVLAAGRARLGGPLEGPPYAPQDADAKPTDRDLLWGAFLRSGCCLSLARMLADLKEPTAGTVVAGLLKDDDPAVRIRAADLLGHVKAKETWRTLLASVEPPANREVIRHVGWALGELNEPASIDAIVAAMEKHKATENDLYLLEGLGKIDAPRARMLFIEKTAERLNHHGNTAFVYAAHRIFERRGNAYVAPLLRALSHEKQAVRTLAALWLSDCFGQATDETCAAAVPRIVAALEARGDNALDAYSRSVLAEILGGIDDPRAVAALKKAARDDPDETVRRVAGKALKAGSKNAEPKP